MNILQNIFLDHYEEMIYTFHPLQAVVENVEKMMHCGDPSFGGAMFGCPDCGMIKFVPFRCHSRFCPSCGVKYSIGRTTSMSFKLVDVPHRHCVFTIAEELRPFFLQDRELLDCLFSSVRSVVLRMFHRGNKSECFTPGFICVLHTFGRDLKWNPHIHCLISEGGIGNSGLWRSFKHFNYKLLRLSFQTALLNELHEKIGDSFKKVKASVYRNQKNGFYVYAKPNLCNQTVVTKYIGRYLGRPVIATSRIDKYDGALVTFHYNRHQDGMLIYETIPVLDFMQRLIRHIPEKNFKMIRYYGIYARHRSSDRKLRRVISKEKHKILLSFNRWRVCLLSSFGYDPLKCPHCSSTMLFLELYFKHKRVPLDELYEKAMAKHRSCRSPSASGGISACTVSSGCSKLSVKRRVVS